MPKNKGAGGKNRKKGKGTNLTKRELVLKDEGQEYAQVVKSVGNGYLDVLCFMTVGNVTKRAHIRGSMRKRVWMTPGDIVLVNVRGFQDDVCDIVMKYTSDEARTLRTMNELPDTVDINNMDSALEDTIVFDDDADSDGEVEEKAQTVPKQREIMDLPSDSDSDDSDIALDDL